MDLVAEMGTENHPKCGLKEILTIVHFFIFFGIVFDDYHCFIASSALSAQKIGKKWWNLTFNKFGYSIMIPRSAETRISGSLPNLLPSVLFRYFFLEKFLLFIVGKSLEPFRRLLT